MTAYAPSDVTSVTVPTHKGGCGQPHTAGDGDRLVVDCDACSQFLVGSASHGFAARPENVMPTCDERAAIERAQAEGEVATQHLMQQMQATAAQMVLGQQSLGQLKAAMMALTPAERRELFGLVDDDMPEQPAGQDKPVARRGRPRSHQD